MGTILVPEEFVQLVEHEVAGEWTNLVVGSWLIISPLVFHFATDVVAALKHNGSRSRDSAVFRVGDFAA